MRAFAVAAVGAVVAAVLLVGSEAFGWGLVGRVLGVVVGAGVVALLLAALAAARRQGVTVEFDEAGYRVAGATGDHAGTWREVKRVTQGPGRLTFHLDADRRFHLVAPGAPERLDAMASDIAKRLDDDRGYRPLA